jgi:hypothetical protein
MSTIKRGKKGKAAHYPPSYYRYNDRKPGIFIRLTKEKKEALDKYKGTMSYGDAIGTLLDSKLNNDGEKYKKLKTVPIRKNRLDELFPKKL